MTYPQTSHIRRLKEHDLLSPRQWRRRILLWTGAILVGMSAIVFAATCGFALALLGLASSGHVHGTGYDQARAILENAPVIPLDAFGVLKFCANTVSYWAGIPGGIFSPALAVGAGIGHNLAALVPGAQPSAVVLLGMAGYLARVAQAPLTSAVISMELTDNREMVIPILAVCLLARAAASLIVRTPVYKVLANRLVDELGQARSAAAPSPSNTVDTHGDHA